MALGSNTSEKASQAILEALPTLSPSVFPKESAFGMLYRKESIERKEHAEETAKETDPIFGATQRADRRLRAVTIPNLERDGSRSKYAIRLHEWQSSFIACEYRQDRRNPGPRTKTAKRINQKREVRTWQP